MQPTQPKSSVTEAEQAQLAEQAQPKSNIIELSLVQIESAIIQIKAELRDRPGQKQPSTPVGQWQAQKIINNLCRGLSPQGQAAFVVLPQSWKKNRYAAQSSTRAFIQSRLKLDGVTSIKLSGASFYAMLLKSTELRDTGGVTNFSTAQKRKLTDEVKDETDQPKNENSSSPPAQSSPKKPKKFKTATYQPLAVPFYRPDNKPAQNIGKFCIAYRKFGSGSPLPSLTKLTRLCDADPKDPRWSTKPVKLDLFLNLLRNQSLITEGDFHHLAWWAESAGTCFRISDKAAFQDALGRKYSAGIWAGQ
ncbi:MAG: hypothetical protein Q9200_003621 [Gallowayella weberi]